MTQALRFSPGGNCCIESTTTSVYSCTRCTTGTTPNELQVVLTGFTNPVIGCTDCTALNATYILPQGSTVGCYYKLNFATRYCYADYLEALITFNGTVGITVSLIPASTGTSICPVQRTWRNLDSTTVSTNCMTYINGLNLPPYSSEGGCCNPPLGSTNQDCIVTGLST